MHKQPGWYTAGINGSDFTGPHQGIEEIVEHFDYCRYIVLNLNDYPVDFKYYDSNIFYFLDGYEQAEYREDLGLNVKLNLSRRVCLLINPFPEVQDDVVYAEQLSDSTGVSLWEN